MAMFNGTIEEFIKYIGPRMRNRINTYTKKERSERNGICEMCGKKAELQSAHVHGSERNVIIRDVLQKYLHDKSVLVDIGKIEEEILGKHDPIGNTFKFLCSKCHREYDSINKVDDGKRNVKKKHKKASPKDISIITKEINKVKRRVPGWFRKKDQINSRIIYKYLKKYKKYNERGYVTFEELKSECSDIDKFDGHYNQMKNFGERNHAKVFEESEGKVYLWEPVKEFIIEEYKNNI